MTTILTDIPFYGTSIGDFLTGWKRINKLTHEALQSELRKAEDYFNESNPDYSNEKNMPEEMNYTKGLAFRFKKNGLTQAKLVLRTIHTPCSDYSPERLTLETGTIKREKLEELTKLF